MVIGLRHWAHSGAHNLSRKQGRVIRDLQLSSAPIGPSISLASTRNLVRECVTRVCGPLRGAYEGLGLGVAALSRVQRRNVLVRQSSITTSFFLEVPFPARMGTAPRGTRQSRANCERTGPPQTEEAAVGDVAWATGERALARCAAKFPTQDPSGRPRCLEQPRSRAYLLVPRWGPFRSGSARLGRSQKDGLPVPPWG